MADEIVVKHGKDGKITVCIGERCVTVACPEAEVPAEEEGGSVGGVILGVQRVADVIGDLDAMEWEGVAPGVQIARSEGARVERHRVD